MNEIVCREEKINHDKIRGKYDGYVKTRAKNPVVLGDRVHLGLLVLVRLMRWHRVVSARSTAKLKLKEWH